MQEKIKCDGCRYCEGIRRTGNTRTSFRCEHPNKDYITNYFNEKRIHKMHGFLGFGKTFSDKVPIKTSPAWCPKKAEGSR